MSTGSTGSLLPKWQMAILLGAPIALGLGYLYYRNQTNKLTEDAPNSESEKKKISNYKDKSISLDGDDKLPKEKAEPKQKTELEQAIAFKNDGNTRFKSGKFNEAIEFYDKAIETCPKSNPFDLSTFYQNRAAAYEQLKKWTAVKDDCTNALKLNSRYVKALFRRAKANESTNELTASLQDITATCILEYFQNNSSLIFADRVLKELGRRDAKETFKNRQIVFPSPNFIRTYFVSYSNDPIAKATDEPLNTDRGLDRAKQALKDAKYEEIIPACTAEIESNETDAHRIIYATLLRGTIFLLIGSLSDAGKDFNFVIDHVDAPTDVKVNALIKRASFNVQNEDHQKGFEDFAAAEKLDPSNADVYYQRGQVFVLLEKTDEALADFTTAVDLAPQMCTAIIQKCYTEYRHACLMQNQVQIYNAIQATHRAAEKFPNNTECYNILAQILTEQQQFDKADELFEKAISIQPTQASLYVHRGLLQLQWNGNIEKALQLLEKAIEIDKKCELAYETLGTIQVQRGLLKEAIDLFEEALKLSRSESEMVHIFSLRNAAIAQLNVAKQLGLDLSALSSLSATGGALA